MPAQRGRNLPAAVTVALALFVAGCAAIGNLASTPIPLPFGGGPQITSGIPFIIMGGADDGELTSIFTSSVPFAVPTSWTASATPAVLTGDASQIGLLRGGSIVTAGGDIQPTPFLPVGVAPAPANSIGFASKRTATAAAEYDTLIPGCSCEGWSVRFGVGTTAYHGGADSNRSDPALFNFGAGATTLVSFETFTDGTNFAVRSIVDVGPMRVTTIVGLRRGDRYASFNITLANTGTSPITNVRFARSLDFDIDASAGGSFSTDRWDVLSIGGVNAIVRGRGTVRNVRSYAVATRSPFLAISDGLTFYTTDPDSFANNDPADAAGDFSSTFVFRVPTIAPGASVTL